MLSTSQSQEARQLHNYFLNAIWLKSKCIVCLCGGRISGHERRRVDGGRKRTNAGSENQERARREPGTSGGAKMDQERLKGAQQQR